MKRIISILLVAMLIIGMFPATVLAADTEIVFALGANGSASHTDGSSSKTTYTETVDGYTLNLTGGTYMYPASRDAKGNSCIKLGTSSKTGGFSFTVPSDVTKVVIAIGKYKTNATKVTINGGTAQTLTKSSNDGAYDEITVDTSSKKTVSVATASGGVRAMVNTITFIIPAAEDACEHPNKTSNNDASPATCTEPGQEDSYYCPDCEETIEAKVIPALGHHFVNDVCDRDGCGKKADVYTLATSETTLNIGDKIIVVANDSNYAMGSQSSNNRGQISITKTDNKIIEPAESVQILTLEAGKKNGTFAFNTGSGYLYAASSSSNYLRTEATLSDNSSWTIAIGEKNVATIIAQGTNTRNTMQYNSSSGLFACYSSASQKAISLYVMSAVTPAEPVINGYVDGEWKEFTSLDEALTASNGNLQLINDVDNINYAGDLYLDLNGFKATNITANAIFAGDSSFKRTEDADGKVTITAGEGTLTTSSEVIVDNTVNGVRYIALEQDGVYTFHALEEQLSTVTLRTSAAGIFYKAKINCDSILAAAVDTYGVALSVRDMPGKDFATEKDGEYFANGWTSVENEKTPLVSGKEFTSGSVFGIFKENKNNAYRGTTKIYANAYIIIDGEILMSDDSTGDVYTDKDFNGTAWSLQDVMLELNRTFEGLGEDQAAVVNFYKTWENAMSDWELTNIATAAAQLI